MMTRIRMIRILFFFGLSDMTPGTKKVKLKSQMDNWKYLDVQFFISRKKALVYSQN